MEPKGTILISWHSVICFRIYLHTALTAVSAFSGDAPVLFFFHYRNYTVEKSIGLR